MRDIRAIATQLKRLKDAGVPVLWRPLHEAPGKWFWWGAHGSEVAKQLWYLIRWVCINEYNLDNLIWVWAADNGSTDFPNWYPGNDFVDIVGFDNYPWRDGHEDHYNYDC